MHSGKKLKAPDSGCCINTTNNPGFFALLFFCKKILATGLRVYYFSIVLEKDSTVDLQAWETPPNGDKCGEGYRLGRSYLQSLEFELVFLLGGDDEKL